MTAKAGSDIADMLFNKWGNAIDKNGSIHLPEKYQKSLRLKSGDEVIIRSDSGEIRIIPSKNVVRKAQKLVRKYIPSDRKLVQDLIHTRKKEAEVE